MAASSGAADARPALQKRASGQDAALLSPPSPHSPGRVCLHVCPTRSRAGWAVRSPQQRSSAWAARGGCGAAASSGGVCADLSAEFHFNETAASREGWERALSPSANRSLLWALSILRRGWAALPSQRTAPVMRGAELPQIGCTQGCCT